MQRSIKWLKRWWKQRCTESLLDQENRIRSNWLLSLPFYKNYSVEFWIKSKELTPHLESERSLMLSIGHRDFVSVIWRELVNCRMRILVSTIFFQNFLAMNLARSLPNLPKTRPRVNVVLFQPRIHWNTGKFWKKFASDEKYLNDFWFLNDFWREYR